MGMVSKDEMLVWQLCQVSADISSEACKETKQRNPFENTIEDMKEGKRRSSMMSFLPGSAWALIGAEMVDLSHDE